MPARAVITPVLRRALPCFGLRPVTCSGVIGVALEVSAGDVSSLTRGRGFAPWPLFPDLSGLLRARAPQQPARGLADAHELLRRH